MNCQRSASKHVDNLARSRLLHGIICLGKVSRIQSQPEQHETKTEESSQEGQEEIAEETDP